MGKRDEQVDSAWVNQRMLECVRMDDDRGLERLLGNYAGEWLDGDACRSEDSEINPVLAALLSPHGPSCIEAFDRHFGDIRRWNHGPWSPLHWAVAQKSSWAVAWCLQDEKPWDRQSDLLAEEQKEFKTSGTASRTPLAVCAQMGDPAWLLEVLKIAKESGVDLARLAKGDRWKGPTAMGMALFEMADRARSGEPAASLKRFEKCARILAKEGFEVDGKVPAAKLCVALALSDREHEGNSAMLSTAKLAMRLGSCVQGDAEPSGGAKQPKVGKGLFEAAGFMLDLDFKEALSLCGALEGPSDCFGVGVGKRVLIDLRACDGSSRFEDQNKYDRLPRLVKATEDSLAASGLDRESWPMRGRERECLLWMGERAKGGDAVGLEQFKESVELSISSRMIFKASKPAVRL